MRVGHGFDVHAFDEERRLVLGGITIPDTPGLAGHSDADVVSHAAADALLGAASLGDLGTHFPPNDRWRDASSLELLREVAARLSKAGFRIVNVDVTVIAERPRLAAHLGAMAGAVAGALGVQGSALSIKATTTDGLGFTGRGEGIAAAAVALIEET
ncbi:MAG TPA: 2-C-methyl-D-erythritol 2,4-cyclodiphosphate synthase [Actinomycetota bacterium]|jgi:2-C-methyl-D-erythritol 2,4-cyclodiphosphate synthase|nr:2-C-methyl-D-erythritol 2,4-cyclodiphosphate synthase [Actinomycetota bacterium]